MLTLVGIIVLTLAGCMLLPPYPSGAIAGFVVNSNAGSPVIGSSITAWREDEPSPSSIAATAVTNAYGYYQLTVPEGTYTIVAQKDGYATSKIVGVKINDKPSELNIIEKPRFNQNWPVTPPNVSLTGVTEGGRYSGPIRFRVNAHGPNDILYIYVALGRTPGSSFTGARQIYESTYTTGDVSIDPANFGVTGNTTFEVVVYDENNDRTQLIRHIYVTPGTNTSSFHPPIHLTVLAVTLCKHVSFFSASAIPSWKGKLRIAAAPFGSDLYVNLTWKASQDDELAGGDKKVEYRIYRRFAWEKDFALIGTVGVGSGNRGNAVFDSETGKLKYYWFRDVSPKLHAGVRVTYQVRAYVGNTESAGVEKSTIPLGKWDVRLRTPADGATEVSLTPTFSWYPTKIVGNDRLYRVRVSDSIQGWRVTSGDPEVLRNKNSCSWDELKIYSWKRREWVSKKGTPWERLQPYRNYEWYMDYAVAYDDYNNPTAVSIVANEGVNWLDPLLATKVFHFTTGTTGGSGE